MEKYKRLTKDKPFEELDLKDEWGYSHIYKRLQEIENKIADKTLVELPCAVGYAVYYVNNCFQTPRIEEYVVYGFSVDNTRKELKFNQLELILGKNVCFSKEEAEKRLKELRVKK